MRLKFYPHTDHSESVYDTLSLNGPPWTNMVPVGDCGQFRQPTSLQVCGRILYPKKSWAANLQPPIGMLDKLKNIIFLMHAVLVQA